MPPRWMFELGGGALCASSLLLAVSLIGVGITGYWLISGVQDRPWYLSPVVALTLNGVSAAWFARLYPFGGV